jgi:hypothetical protein
MVGGAEFPAVRFEVTVQVESGVRSEIGATVVGLAGGALIRAAGGAIGVDRIGAELRSGI